MNAPETKQIRAIDLFAGVGGSSIGAERAGARLVAAVDRWVLARDVYLDNFKDVRYVRLECESVNADALKSRVGPVDLLLASPECTDHTCAKGNSERSEKSRRTAFEVVRFASAFKPRWIVVENVIHMRGWRRYDEWLAQLLALGYKIRTQVLNAADFGVPQSRKRLFVLCDRETIPPAVVRPGVRRVSVKSILNWNGDYQFHPLRTKGRAEATLQRADRAVQAIGTGQSFLLVYYGSDGAGGWQPVSRPLRTVTTIDRFALVRPNGNGHEMRMLQVPEIKAAMGFPSEYRLRFGTRRDQIKLLGNAVCPPLMEAIVRTLCALPAGKTSQHG
jgi:DNA (cytosine-5)-methyltransferase 1